MQFEQIPGLDEVKKLLVASHKNNHIAHAQLFNSMVGGAGLPMAISFATFLLCEDKKEKDSCGKCPSCQRMSKLIHPDVHYIYPKPSATKNKDYEKLQNDSLKKWREFAIASPYSDLSGWINFNGYENKNVFISKEDSRNIVKTVSMKSFEGDFKILIFWYPELMHPAAANAILKVLEEPPTQTIFLLVSYAYDMLLTTIRSRTQIFNIPAFSEITIQKYIETHHQTDAAKATRIAKLSGGSLGKAISEIDHSDSIAHENFRQWMHYCRQADFSALVKFTDSFVSQTKPQQRNQLEYNIALIRDAMLSKAGDTKLVYREGPESEFVHKFGQFASMEALEGMYKSINTSLGDLERNANPKITITNLSIECSQYLRGS